MLAMLKPEEMDEKFAMDYLDELEFTARQLENDPSQEGQEKTGSLIDRVKNRLAKCLKRRQKANYRSLCKSNLSKIWQLKKLVAIHPSLVLHEPDDFILYWYVHGEFPCDMSSWDMEQTRRKLQYRLNQIICQEKSDDVYAPYRREKIKAQLQQLQDMIAASSWEDDGEEGEDSGNWMDEDAEDAAECPDGGPIYLAFLPEEPEHPEDMTIPELGLEIEKQEYNLLSLKSEELGQEESQKPTNLQEAMDSVKACLDRLRTILRQRTEEALGVEAEDSSVPEGFQDGDFPIWIGMGELERAADIVGRWYLLDDFPLIVSCEKLMQVEAELKRQQSVLEAEEPALESGAEHALWQFRREQRAEQLEQIQTMMRNQADDWEYVDLEEEPADEW